MLYLRKKTIFIIGAVMLFNRIAVGNGKSTFTFIVKYVYVCHVDFSWKIFCFENISIEFS